MAKPKTPDKDKAKAAPETPEQIRWKRFQENAAEAEKWADTHRLPFMLNLSDRDICRQVHMLLAKDDALGSIKQAMVARVILDMGIERMEELGLVKRPVVVSPADRARAAWELPEPAAPAKPEQPEDQPTNTPATETPENASAERAGAFSLDDLPPAEEVVFRPDAKYAFDCRACTTHHEVGAQFLFHKTLKEPYGPGCCTFGQTLYERVQALTAK